MATTLSNTDEVRRSDNGLCATTEWVDRNDRWRCRVSVDRKRGRITIECGSFDDWADDAQTVAMLSGYEIAPLRMFAKRHELKLVGDARITEATDEMLSNYECYVDVATVTPEAYCNAAERFRAPYATVRGEERGNGLVRLTGPRQAVICFMATQGHIDMTFHSFVDIEAETVES